MAGMRALGRVYDQIAVAAAGTAIVCAKDCSGIGVLAVAGATATGTLTVSGMTAASGGTTTAWTPGNGFGLPPVWFSRTAATAAWVPNAASWSTNALTIDATSGHMSYVDFLVSEFADTYDYIKIVAGAAISLTVSLFDLNVQRKPANLRIPGA